MERGFIQDILDVKVLVLYVMDRVMYPVDLQKIYELTFQDDKLSYFDLAQAVPEMVASGHLQEVEGERYVITEKGKDANAVTEDSIAYPVMLRAQTAVEQFNRQTRRSAFVDASHTRLENGEYSVTMTLSDEHGELFRLSLTAPSQKHAHRLAKAFKDKAELVYRDIMNRLLTDSQEDT